MNAKKVLAAVIAVCVVSSAGSALAQSKRTPQPRQPQAQQQMFPRNQEAPRFGGCPCWGDGPRGMNWQPSPFQRPERPERPAGPDRQNFDPRGQQDPRAQRDPRGPRFTPDMPKEIREKAAEIAKLRIDLDEALSSNPIDRNKALEVHGKIQKLEQELSQWRFNQRLDRIEAFKKQQELNRNFRPAPPAPEAPAPEAPAPEVEPEAPAPAE